MIAARKLGWKTIDTQIVEADGDQQVLIMNAVENLQRQDVSFQEQGRIFQLLKDMGLSQKNIAARIGISDSKVRSIMDAYLHVPLDIRGDIEHGVGTSSKPKSGTLTPRVALQVTNLAKNLKLDAASRASLIKYAKTTGSLEKMKELGQLLAQGESVTHALEAIEKIRIVSVKLAIPIKKIKRIEKQEGERIHVVLRKQLLRNLGLKVRGRRKAVAAIIANGTDE